MRANELLAPLPHAIAAEPGQHTSFRRQFPGRPQASSWPASLLTTQQILARIDTPPFRPANGDGYRRHGTARMLDWLDSFSGGSWQQRWKASGAEGRPKEEWLGLPMQWPQAPRGAGPPCHQGTFPARPALRGLARRSCP